MSTKDTNPKDAVGIAKVPASTVPREVIAEVGLAMMEGALKYGRHNYRDAGVRASVYYDACTRHLDAFYEGQDTDPDSGVGLSHLVKAIACLVVLRDSQFRNNWTDDRPPKLPDNWQADLNAKAAALLEKYPNPVAAHTEKKPATGGPIFPNITPSLPFISVPVNPHWMHTVQATPETPNWLQNLNDISLSAETWVPAGNTSAIIGGNNPTMDEIVKNAPDFVATIGEVDGDTWSHDPGTIVGEHPTEVTSLDEQWTRQYEWHDKEYPSRLYRWMRNGPQGTGWYYLSQFSVGWKWSAENHVDNGITYVRSLQSHS